MANNIKKIRLDRGLSQEELGRRIGASKQMVGRLESGKRQLTQRWIESISNALECHPAELLTAATPTAKQLSAEEEALLRLYQGLGEQDRQAVFRHADALAKPKTGSDRKIKGG